MGYEVSMTREGVTYRISAEDKGTFVAFYNEVDGLDGFMEAVRELHQGIAERAVAPIAAADQDGPDEPQTTPGVSDELADLIRGAPDVNALTGLYRAHKSRWNGDYNKLAGKRRQELDKAAK